MGSTVESDETPHHVTFSGRFYMAATEVTNAQYTAVLQWAYDHDHVTATTASVRDVLDGSTIVLFEFDSPWNQISFSDGVFSTSNPDHPVEGMPWVGAAAYCDWMSLHDGLARAYNHNNWSCNTDNPYSAAGYRLPTEAEWEFACRAGTTTPFNTGDCLDSATEANFVGDFQYTDCPTGPSLGGLADVGSYPANQWGLYEMHGNVYEWCNDWYGSYVGDQTDPEGPGSGDSHVLRGGSRFYRMYSCRSACRSSSSVHQDNYFGFRPVKSVN